MKRAVIKVIALIILALSLAVASFAVSDLKISGANYPTTIIQGNTFSVYGTITSSNSITSVTCSVFSTNGTTQFTKTVEPDSYEFSVHSIDAYMTFSKLKSGTYRYKITASDTETKNVNLLDKTFDVLSTENDSTLAISDANYPTRIIVGNTFSVYGKIVSENTITSVTASVYNSKGTTQFSKTVNPGSSSYSIHNIDYYMTFSKLSVGTYTYRITASDNVSKNIILLEKKFTVAAQGGAEENLEKVNWDVLDLSQWNTISSWPKISDSVDGVILRIGYRGTVNRTIGYDTKFADSYKKAKSQGLHIGCYFFSNALNKDEAVEEAKFVISKLKENDCQLDMPVYIDMETEDQVALTRSQTNEIARAFYDEMKNNGYYAGIYCNMSFGRDELNPSELTDITFWIAQYDSSCTYPYSYGMWQYSESGSNQGITGNVDSNYCYYDYPSYIVKNNLNGYSKAPVPEFTINNINGVSVDSSSNIIYGVKPGISTSDFSSEYIKSSGVNVSFDNTADGNIATGTVITAKANGEVIASYSVSVSGDLNGDSSVNSADALCVLQYCVRSRELNNTELLSADYNGDKAVNSVDALSILKYIVGE
jgi:GH25 family lysozyme M1 (1,4-beta-N-acetylmuramidase)